MRSGCDLCQGCWDPPPFGSADWVPLFVHRSSFGNAPLCSPPPKVANTHPHGSKDDGKVVLVVIHDVFRLLHQPGLPADLGCYLGREKRGVCVWQGVVVVGDDFWQRRHIRHPKKAFLRGPPPRQAEFSSARRLTWPYLGGNNNYIHFHLFSLASSNTNANPGGPLENKTSFLQDQACKATWTVDVVQVK